MSAESQVATILGRCAEPLRAGRPPVEPSLVDYFCERTKGAELYVAPGSENSGIVGVYGRANLRDIGNRAFGTFFVGRSSTSLRVLLYPESASRINSLGIAVEPLMRGRVQSNVGTELLTPFLWIVTGDASNIGEGEIIGTTTLNEVGESAARVLITRGLAQSHQTAPIAINGATVTRINVTQPKGSGTELMGASLHSTVVRELRVRIGAL